MKKIEIEDFVGKTIKRISVDGYGVELITDDGCRLDYGASDGGYSSFSAVYDPYNEGDESEHSR